MFNNFRILVLTAPIAFIGCAGDDQVSSPKSATATSTAVVKASKVRVDNVTIKFEDSAQSVINAAPTSYRIWYTNEKMENTVVVFPRSASPECADINGEKLCAWETALRGGYEYKKNSDKMKIKGLPMGLNRTQIAIEFLQKINDQHHVVAYGCLTASTKDEVAFKEALAATTMSIYKGRTCGSCESAEDPADPTTPCQ